jgi:ribonucleoside-diphosphate reductase alpha chain
MSQEYEELSSYRKELQQQGLLPEWYTTAGYQLLKGKYLSEGETPRDRYKSVARTAAQYMPNSEEWEEKFFDVMWKGWLSPATPVLSNMGTDKGCSVSCSGTYVGDSVHEFYEVLKENAILSQNGFGTSAYLGDIRPRGSEFRGDGKASGVLPVVKDYIKMAQNISQGSNRRGSIGLYIEADHKDFWEVADYLFHHPDDANIGWLLTPELKDRLDSGCKEALKVWQRICKIRSVLGRGYLMKTWTAQEQRPQMYVDKGLDVKASNLCSEVMLHSSEELSYTCVLSSMNLVYWNEWKDTDAVEVATVFLDCVAEHFIQQGSKIKGLEKAVEFTKKGRALGLGCLGLHTYLQENLIPFESIEAQLWNNKVFKHINKQSTKASEWMAKELGEPEWCVGYGVRNTHRTAIAPTMSTSLLVGSISQGIEPISMNVYSQVTAAGTVRRINPSLLKIMEEREVYNKETLKDIEDNAGSIQHVNWLSELEKEVFKTAFEINQKALLRLASQRQKFICQSQSLNLFFDAEEKEEWISEVLQEFIEDSKLITLYYQRSQSGVKASTGECIACHA